MPEEKAFPRVEQPGPAQNELERVLETSGEQPVESLETTGEQPTAIAPPLPVAPAQLPTAATPDQAPTLKRVEHILATGLEGAYHQMDPATQSRFKVTGERTATAITGLLQSTKVQTKKIIDLIVAWLRIIPGVNKFFLEQEAKIKADQLLALRERPPQP